MSKVNIKGLVENIKERSNIYTPIIEAIVNSIESIESSHREDGKIEIIVERDNNPRLNFESDALADIIIVRIEDNGIGFNNENRDSFDTLYGDLKIQSGGKGFGRFMFLKFFELTKVDSIFKENGKTYHRTFNLGSNEDIIENENCEEVKTSEEKTIVSLNGIKEKKLDKKIETLARRLVEKLLIFFITEDFKCPEIILKESESEKKIILNEYIGSDEHAEIQELTNHPFTLQQDSSSEDFTAKIFKLFYPHGQKSKIILTAHKREVTETPLQNYIPEFADDFYEDFENETRKDYIIKTYILGKYLNENVSLERSEFYIRKRESDFSHPFSQEDIEKKAANITKNIFPEELNTRENKKREAIQDYVNNEAPWHKHLIKDLDLSKISFNPSEEQIEVELSKFKLRQDQETKREVNKILENDSFDSDESLDNLISKITQAGMSELAHYVAERKKILKLLANSLEKNEEGKYKSENAVHSIIFPTRTDSETCKYDDHNLWILDEKLNFTNYLSSDKPLDESKTDRPDIIIFNKKIAVRGENESSNPITIFEFKKPQRDDFANQSSSEDPVDQIIRYVNNIKEGKIKTTNGRDIAISDNTPFYGFIVCDLTQKVKDWLHGTKDFKQMPDGKGWFQWFNNINLYTEVISWDKLLKDSEMRNKIFFKKLGIE